MKLKTIVYVNVIIVILNVVFSLFTSYELNVTYTRMGDQSDRHNRASDVTARYLTSLTQQRLASIQFVATGNPAMEQKYREVIDIRNGRAKRSADDPVAPNRIVSVFDLMNELGFTARERELVESVAAERKFVLDAEEEAINAVKGLFRDDKGGFTVRGTPDKEHALSLLFSDEFIKNFDAITKSVTRLDQAVDERYKEYDDAADALYKKFDRLNTLSTVLFIAQVLFIFYVLLRRILSPLLSTSSFAETVAQGHLDEKLSHQSSDEIGQLADALRKMVSSLKEMILSSEAKSAQALAAQANAERAMVEAENAQQDAMKAKGNAEKASQEALVAKESAEKSAKEAEAAKRQAERAMSEGMQSAANKLESVVNIIASASTELTAQIETSEDGAQKQQTLLTETTKAMGEMNVVVGDVSRNAATTSEVATQTRNSATEGSELVKKLVAAINQVQTKAAELKEDMNTLSQQTETVSQVMALISSIADQTNLLALNASIEAARAGEAGASFAVVAEEVRKLAEKTMHSTVDVGNSIRAMQESAKGSADRVDETVKVIEKATEYAEVSGKALLQIVGKVDETSDQIRAIAAACEEQSATTAHVSDSVININDLSNLTAQAMKMSVQAVEDLSKQAETLKKMIEEMKRS